MTAAAAAEKSHCHVAKLLFKKSNQTYHKLNPALQTNAIFHFHYLYETLGCFVFKLNL